MATLPVIPIYAISRSTSALVLDNVPIKMAGLANRGIFPMKAYLVPTEDAASTLTT